MKVLILTNVEYDKFVQQQTAEFTYDNEIKIALSQKWAEHYFNENYDVGISFMYQHKVPAKEVNTHPWFNFHPAPLPEYKGRDLCYHAIMNGEKEFGATIHYMDENFDTGDIIEVVKFDLDYWMTSQEVSEQAVMQSMTLFERYFPMILETPVFSRVPNHGGTYYKKGQIIEEVPVRPDDPFGQFVRAVSFPSKGFHPRIDIGGIKYKIVREE